MLFFNRLLSRVAEDEKGEVEVNTLFEAFSFEMKESGVNYIFDKRAFVYHIPKVFPNAVRKRCKSETTITKYMGITLKPISPEPESTSATTTQNIRDLLPSSVKTLDVNNTFVKCSVPSNIFCDGNEVFKIVTFFSNGEWTLDISGTKVDIESLFLSNQFTASHESILIVLKGVNLLKFCDGVAMRKDIIISRYHTLNKWNICGLERRQLHSIVCNKFVPMTSMSGTCIKCRKMTMHTVPCTRNTECNDKENAENIKHSKVNYTNLNNGKESSTLKDDIKKLFPNAPQEMIELLLSQAVNVARDPKGRRWPQSIISLCLQWFCRSPQSYEAVRASKFLILPSRSVLIRYKTQVTHNVGFDDEVLLWMHEEAKRQNIPENGYVGGLIIDEMSIQADIQICKSGDVVELAGLMDLGDEGNISHALRKGNNEKELGTHALQILFLGITGFRFPIAHFISDGVQAPELYPIFWQAVDKLKLYGFTVAYTCMDGAQSNRSFMKANIGKQTKTFASASPCTFGNVIFMMDFSHVVKKIRNNIIKSGISKKSTRTLTLVSGHTVQWQMFIDTYQWDKSNGLQLHRRLTNEHMFLSNQSKMRNHLAEDVLNSEMLNLVLQYQQYLGEKGEVLNGLVELLQQTSKLIQLFRDMRPVRATDDPRLTELLNISQWFTDWETYSLSNTSVPKSMRQKTILSSQCHEDIQACIIGFVELCTMLITPGSAMHITPGLVNSDAVENLFNQQRSTYNGANTNPNALQYRRSLNSILLGQNVVSQKANAGKNRIAALPFNCTPKTVTKKRPTHFSSSCKPIKVIRM